MRKTNIAWPCKKCFKEFRLFSDDGCGDFTICWNYCPYCGERNDIWIRLLWRNQIKYGTIPLGISPEEGAKLKARLNKK